MNSTFKNRYLELTKFISEHNNIEEQVRASFITNKAISYYENIDAKKPIRDKFNPGKLWTDRFDKYNLYSNNMNKLKNLIEYTNSEICAYNNTVNTDRTILKLRMAGQSVGETNIYYIVGITDEKFFKVEKDPRIASSKLSIIINSRYPITSEHCLGRLQETVNRIIIYSRNLGFDRVVLGTDSASFCFSVHETLGTNCIDSYMCNNNDVLAYVNKLYANLEYNTTLNIKSNKPISEFVHPDILINYLMDRYDAFSCKSTYTHISKVLLQEKAFTSFTLELLKRVLYYKIAYEIAEDSQLLDEISKKLTRTNSITKTRSRLKNMCDTKEIKDIYSKLSQYLIEVQNTKHNNEVRTIEIYETYKLFYNCLDALRNNNSKLTKLERNKKGYEYSPSEFEHIVKIKNSVISNSGSLVNEFINNSRLSKFENKDKTCNDR